MTAVVVSAVVVSAAGRPGPGASTNWCLPTGLLVMLVHLRTQLPHAAPAELYGVARSTITEAIGELRPLLGDRGFGAAGRHCVAT